MSFQNLRGGDRIRFLIPNGKRIVNGRVEQEYKAVVAKVQPMLVFDDHVIANLGGKYGRPAYVDSVNYLGRA
jgi:hypothetical protein